MPVTRCLMPVLATTSLLSGCAMLDGGCYQGSAATRATSTPLVSFLYPDGDVATPADHPVMPVPMRVGLAFVPGNYGSQPVTERYAVLERVRARFAKLPYVESISIVPEGYLNPRSGFTGLEQLARLQGYDALALVSMDQVATRRDNRASLLYLTILGAYVVEGSDQETHTLLDLAVVEPRSRALLLRAAGTSALAGDSTLVDQPAAIDRQRAGGLELATAQLSDNLAIELDRFAARVRNGTAPVAVAKRGGSGGGGAFGGGTLAVLAALLLMPRGVRAFRGSGRPASALR
ncbi:MAG: rhombotarget lipoprotein [Steroidobacteraceae bacterium]